MNDLDLLIGKVARNSFTAGFVVGAVFVGLAVLIGLLF